MLEALKVVGRAFAAWWREWPLLMLLNLAWLVLQVPIITGPPATAAMYVMARRVADGELVSPKQAWQSLRDMFRPAWGWGALNAVIVIVLIGNFVAYGTTPGLGWAALRLAWGSIATLWFALNLFYWPFWLAQADRRLVTTLRNALLMFLKAPAFGLTLLLVCAALVLVSVAVTLPFAATLMSWLALIGVLAVDAALRQPDLVEPSAPTEMDAL